MNQGIWIWGNCAVQGWNLNRAMRWCLFTLILLGTAPHLQAYEDCNAVDLNFTNQGEYIYDGLEVNAVVEMSGVVVKFFVGTNSFQGGTPNYNHYQTEDHNAPYEATLTIFEADDEVTAAAYSKSGSLLATCTRTAGESQGGSSSSAGVKPIYERARAPLPRHNGLPVGVAFGSPRETADRFCKDKENKTHAVRWTIKLDTAVGTAFQRWNSQSNQWVTDEVKLIEDELQIGDLFASIRCNTPTLRPISILRKSTKSKALYAAGYCLEAGSGERVLLNACNGWENQKWQYDSSDKRIKTAGGRCLTAYDYSVEHASCTSNSEEQQWSWGNSSPNKLSSRSDSNLCLSAKTPDREPEDVLNVTPRTVSMDSCQSNNEKQLWYLDERPRAKMVVMGDSFASGEGLLEFDPNTDTATNNCHRSKLAYGPALADEWDHNSLIFKACSGAKIEDVFQFDARTDHGGLQYEGSQIYRLGGRERWGRDPEVGIVTISIGGNDAGFYELIKNCLWSNQCDNDKKEEIDKKLGILTDISHDSEFMYDGLSNLANLYLEIGRRAPNAEIRVINYPPVVDQGGCKVEMADIPLVDINAVEFDEFETLFLADVINRLNQAIQN